MNIYKSTSVNPYNVDNSVPANRAYLMPRLSFKLFTALHAHYLMTAWVKNSILFFITANNTLIILVPLLIYIQQLDYILFTT